MLFLKRDIFVGSIVSAFVLLSSDPFAFPSGVHVQVQAQLVDAFYGEVDEVVGESSVVYDDSYLIQEKKKSRNDDDKSNSNSNSHSHSSRRLGTNNKAHYAHVGLGVCNTNPTAYVNVFHGFSNPDEYQECLNRCGTTNLMGVSVREESWEVCTKMSWDFLKFKDVCTERRRQYRTHCRCHHDNAVTGLWSDSNHNCYFYKFGDQLVGTSQQYNFIYQGTGQCVGSVGGSYFTQNQISGVDTDWACANLCDDSANYIGFQRRSDINRCDCLSQNDNNGDIRAAGNEAEVRGCYSRTVNKIYTNGNVNPSDTGFTFQGDGLYSSRVDVGEAAVTDAECAKKCLDKKNSGGIATLVGISKHITSNTCYCATGGSVQVNYANRVYASYSLDSSRVFSCPARSGMLATLNNGKIELTTVCKCTDYNGGTAKSLSIKVYDDDCSCPILYNSWCTDDIHNNQFDCDGDGNNDSLCVYKEGYKMLKSQNQCIDNLDVVGGSVLTDCVAAEYGSQALISAWTPKYIFRGIGPCWGSFNSQEFSNFKIDLGVGVESDAACAAECENNAKKKQYVVGFSRRVYLNECYCHFQQHTVDFNGEYESSGVTNYGGVGGVITGNDRRFSCYQHYQEENQVMDARSNPFYLNDGRTRYETKGKGPCKDGLNEMFPSFQILNQETAASDEACWTNCEAAYSDIVGITRYGDQCFCNADETDLDTISTEVSTSVVRPGVGTGEVFEGWLKEYSCMGRIEGFSGFKFIGMGGCSDANNNYFPHFRISTNTHTEAQCAKLCLEAIPSEIRGFTRNRNDFSCYCAYSTGTSLDSPYDNTGTYPRLWADQGGAGTVVNFKTTETTNVYACYGLDETSRVTDCPTNSALTTALESTGLKILESWCDCNSGNGKDVYEVDDTCSCYRPYAWCTEPGDEYFYLDCDGDSTLDSVCTSADGRYTAMLSQSACNEQGGTSGVTGVCNEVSGCSASDVSCSGGGDVYSSLDCDGDGAKDAVCEKSGGSYNVARSSNGCTEETSVDVGLVCPVANSCTRGSNWCTAPNSRYFFIDCSGDGALDSICQTIDSNTGVVSYQLQLSTASPKCVETTADDSSIGAACAAFGCVRPDVWCGLPGSQYYHVDCNDDDILDSHCRAEDGRVWTILSDGNGSCKRTRHRCPAADYCVHVDDWCHNAGSHYYWTDPDGTYGDNDSQCITNIGTQWEDTNCYRELAAVRTEREYILSKT